MLLRLEITYRGLITIVLLLIAAWAFIELWPVVLLVLVSLILMVGLLPFVDAMVRIGVRRTTAVLLLTFGILMAVGGALSLIVPAVIDEAASVRQNLPESAREVELFLAEFGLRVELQQRARDINWGELISGRAAVNYGQQLLSTTVSLITIVVMTAYLLADTPRLARFIGQFISDEQKPEAESIFLSLERVVGGYLRGQLITSLAIGLFTFIMLEVLGVPNSLAFAAFAAFADVVPLVGALVATIPPAAAALQISPTHSIAVIVGMFLYQQFEDRILAPRVYGRTLNLPPIIVLIAVLAGAELLGVTGVLLALPLTAAARVAIDYTIEHRRLPLMAQAGEQPLAPDQPAPEPESETTPPARRRRLRLPARAKKT
jgi:predicted PurR-regulated permease PerM